MKKYLTAFGALALIASPAMAQDKAEDGKMKCCKKDENGKMSCEMMDKMAHEKGADKKPADDKSAHEGHAGHQPG